MAYTKPFKVIQDTWVTLDDWNQLQANEADARDVVLGVGHEKNTAGSSTLRPFGAHIAKEIPRAIIRAGVLKDSGGEYVNHWTYVQDGLYGYIIRTGVGKYRVGVRIVSSNTQYPFCMVTPETDGTALRDIAAKYTNGGDNNLSFVGYELTLTEWDAGSGSWELADFGFTLVAYSVHP